MAEANSLFSTHSQADLYFYILSFEESYKHKMIAVPSTNPPAIFLLSVNFPHKPNEYDIIKKKKKKNSSQVCTFTISCCFLFWNSKFVYRSSRLASFGLDIMSIIIFSGESSQLEKVFRSICNIREKDARSFTSMPYII